MLSFFFNTPATTVIYPYGPTLSRRAALPIFARQPRHDGRHGRPQGAVAGIPGDLQGPAAADAHEDTVDISLEDGYALDLAAALLVGRRRCKAAEFLNVRTEEGRARKSVV